MIPLFVIDDSFVYMCCEAAIQFSLFIHVITVYLMLRRRKDDEVSCGELEDDYAGDCDEEEWGVDELHTTKK